ncbi:MAG: hypothetical protein ACT4OH_00965 [Methylophilaceae bacterium]
MDILNSDWLIHMLKKAGKTPQMRLLSMFDILDDWANAPGMSTEINVTQLSANNSLLQTYLALEAAKAGAAFPEMLATQLYFMAVSATQEKLQGTNSAGLQHAKSAAEALMIAQTKKEFRIAKSSAYAIAASFMGVLVVVASMLLLNQENPKNDVSIAMHEPVTKPARLGEFEFIASPQQTSALFAQVEMMRKGNCQLIEAIQLPDSYKKVYFENIVLGQISTDPSEQKLVLELLQKVRCNYTPILMANSR